MSTLTATQLQQQYIAYFGRPGDPAGIKYWLSSSSGVSSAREFADKIYAQDEYKKSTVGSKSTEAQVNSLYQNLFGREADASGLIYWTGQIEAGTLTLSNIAYDLIAAASNPVSGNETQGAADALALGNKVAAAEAFTADVEASTSAILAYQPESSSPWVTGSAFESGKSYLTGITTTAHTAAGIDTAVSAMVTSNTSAGSTVAGSTSKFTDGTDNLVGGAGADTYNGVIQILNGAATTGTTLAPGDSVDGKGGTDTLGIAIAGTANADYNLTAVSTDNLEKVLTSNFQTSNSYDVLVNASLMDSALTTVGSSASSDAGDTEFTGLKKIVDAEMRNGGGDVKVTYNTSVTSGTADVQNLTVSNLTAGTFTSNGAETLNITTELAKSTLAAAVDTSLKTVNISGSQNLTITTALDFAANGSATKPGAVIDASTFTGDLKVGTTASEVLKITGGTGNDTFTLGSLTKDDTVDGGAGIDTITVAAATFSTEFAKVSNVEKIDLGDTGATLTLDVSKFSAGVTDVTISIKDDDDNAIALASTISGVQSENIIFEREDTDADLNGVADVTITPKTDTESNTLNLGFKALGLDGDDASGGTAEEGLGNVNVANFETVNITTGGDTAKKANNLADLTATKATAINISGDAALTLDALSGGALTKLDASGLDAALTVTLEGDKVAITGAPKSSTYNFGSTLDNNDSVVGGAGTADAVTATFSSVAEATGTLNISGVETITLSNSGTNTFDFSSVTGATTIASTGGTNTIKGFDLLPTLSATGDNTLKVTGKDVTGSADVLKVSSVEANSGATNTIEAVGIETLEVTVKDTDSNTGVDTRAFDLDKFEGTSVKISQDAASTTNLTVTLNSTILHKNVTNVDTTGLKGLTTIDATNATNAVTFDASSGSSSAAVQTLTGGAKGDTFNIAESGAVDHVITGNGGTDTTNIAIKNGYADPSSIATEVVNYTVKAGDDITLTGVNTTGTTAINLKGGNSISTFTTAANGVVAELKTFDASEFLGNAVVFVTQNIIDDTVVFTGGPLTTDEIEYTLQATGTDKLYSSGFEIIDLLFTASATLDTENATGITTVDVNATAGVTATISKLTGSELILVTNASANSDVTPVLADATGSSDSITFEIKDGSSDIAVGADLNTDDIETVTIKSSSAESLDLSGLAMTTADKVMTLKVTGDSQLTVSSLGADVTTIDASGMTDGGFIQTGRSSTVTATYTGSPANDTFMMTKITDAIAAGGQGSTGGDTLDLNYTAVISGMNIDLSLTGDQVTFTDGSANAAVQSGFENLDLRGVTGYGAVITGSKGVNNVIGTAAVDNINLGAGNDTFEVVDTKSDTDIVDGGTGTNTLNISASTGTFATDANLANFANVTVAGGATVVLTGQTEDFSISGGSAGIQIITGGAGADTIAVDDDGLDGVQDEVNFGADLAANGVDTVTGLFAGAGGDLLDFRAFNGGIALGALGAAVSEGNEAGENVTMGSLIVGTAEGTGTALDGHVFFVEDTSKTTAEMKTLIETADAANKLSLASGAKAVMIHGEMEQGDSGAMDVYYIVGGGSDNETMTKVGTVAFDDNGDANSDNIIA